MVINSIFQYRFVFLNFVSILIQELVDAFSLLK